VCRTKRVKDSEFRVLVPCPATNARDEFQVLLGGAADEVVAPDVPSLQDDRPFNEYFLIRWTKRTGSFQKLAHC
jgi:sarcosine oxidase delta subunit